ncbi:MAG: ABC transporter substrate-binding protein [Planctomycetota bacterium]|jgi:NitT/TauT family transport system substrate-binding protein|nr:ABC transporter substrate-binding protein [Planctomycetota bacterium]
MKTLAKSGFPLAILIAGCGGPPPQEVKEAPVAPKVEKADAPVPAEKSVKVQLALNWFPEAEHGGYYAALVHGFYQEAGLDVEILGGGPGAPVIPRVATGQVTFGVTNADRVLFGRAQKAPVVALMAPLQNSPRCIMVHEKSGIEGFDSIKDMTLAMSSKAAFSHFLRKKFAFKNVKIVPYPGNVSKFLLDENFAQQGYVFSEPFVAKQKGGDPKSLMVSETGWNPYTSLLVTGEETTKSKSDTVKRMVGASVRGWLKYLEEPDATNKHIHKLNPEMGMEILAYGVEQMKSLVQSNETKKSGFGIMTRERWQLLYSQMQESELLKDGDVAVEAAFTIGYLPKQISDD